MYAGIRARHHNWDSMHVTGLSVYARGSFPRWSSQTRTASEFTHYPSQELKRALGWDITRHTSFEAFGGFGSCLNETGTDVCLILRDVSLLEIGAVAAHMV